MCEPVYKGGCDEWIVPDPEKLTVYCGQEGKEIRDPWTGRRMIRCERHTSGFWEKRL